MNGSNSSRTPPAASTAYGVFIAIRAAVRYRLGAGDLQGIRVAVQGLGAVINEDTLPRLQATVIAGGANNQLATQHIGEALRDRGILYAPDYVVNGGGIIDLHYQINGGTREQGKVVRGFFASG